MAAASACSASTPPRVDVHEASRSVTAKPSRAKAMAGARSRASGSRPRAAWASHHPSTAPGVVRVAGRMPRMGISSMPRLPNHSRVPEAAARPPALRKRTARRRGVPDQPELIAADAGHVRVDHGEDGARGDGGVHRRAAGLEHLDARLGRQRHGDMRPCRSPLSSPAGPFPRAPPCASGTARDKSRASVARAHPDQARTPWPPRASTASASTTKRQAAAFLSSGATSSAATIARGSRRCATSRGAIASSPGTTAAILRPKSRRTPRPIGTTSSWRIWPRSCAISASSAPTWADSPWAATWPSTSASRHPEHVGEPHHLRLRQRHGGAGDLSRRGRERAQEFLAEGIEAKVRNFAGLASRRGFAEKDPRGWAEFLQQVRDHSPVGSAPHAARRADEAEDHLRAGAGAQAARGALAGGGGRSGRALPRAQPVHEAPHPPCGPRHAAHDRAHRQHRGARALQSAREPSSSPPWRTAAGARGRRRSRAAAKLLVKGRAPSRCRRGGCRCSAGSP